MSSGSTPGGQAAPPAADPCSTSQPPDAAPLGLVDMPAAWLQLLPAAVGSDMILPLFSSCRALRDLVLSQRTVRVEYRIRITRDHQAAAQAKLLTACKYAPSVNLSFHFDQMVAHNSDSAGRMITSTMAAAGRPLTAITSVEMTNLHLDHVVPLWLTSTCPNMRRLNLCTCLLTRAPTTNMPPCPKLKQLQLQLIRTQMPTLQEAAADRTPHTSVAVVVWQQQLSALPSLDSLSLHGNANPKFMAQCLSVLRSQLTHVQFDAEVLQAVQPQLWQLVSCLPFMQHLHLDDITVYDEIMGILLGLPTLRKLECKAFKLQHSYSHRPCPWTHLGFTELDVTSVDRLALAGVQQFTLPVAMVILSQELAANVRVAAAVVMCGIQWGPLVTISWWGSDMDSTCMEALIPIFSTSTASTVAVEKLKFSSWMPVTPGLLTAMGQHLSSFKLLEVVFDNCIFTSEQVWPLLLPSMPLSVQLVCLESGIRVPEAHVTEMCVHACRPVRLMINDVGRSQWQAGWEGRVQVAMAAAGHQHVVFDHVVLA